MRDRAGTTGSSRVVLAAGLVLLLLAAAAPGLRIAIALVLAIGWVALWAGRRPESVGWAALLPVAIALPWAILAGADVPLGAAGCVDPASAIVARRMLLAVVVLVVVAGLARAVRSDAAELGLRTPARWEAAVAVAGGCLVAAGGLVIGPWLARPFFGALDFPVPPAALLPAVVFGLANGVVEELSYRGAMQGWLGRGGPGWLAIGYPALVFGIVHAGPDVVALLPLHVALLAGVGLAGGLVRARTGTLAIPIGIHVGADIALYVGLACRAAGSA